MSAAFTSGENAQSLAMANELVLAYSERRQVLGQSAASALSVGDNAQDKSLWLGMQTWLESNCTSFIDHVNGPLNPAGTDFLYFTKATWQTAAGLNVSAGDGESFRRKVNPGDEVSYGHLAAGDYHGNLDIFEDLQKGLGALTWSPWTIGEVSTGDHWISGTREAATWNEAKTLAEANWHILETGTLSYPYCMSDSYYGDEYQVSLVRYSLYLYANALPPIARVPVLYTKGANPRGVFNGNGDVSEGFTAIDTLSESTDTDIYSSHFRSSSVPAWGDAPPKDYTVYYTGYSGQGGWIIKWLMKWNFTNA